MRRALLAGLLAVAPAVAAAAAEERLHPEPLSARLAREAPARRPAVWVYLADKGPVAEAMALAERTVNPRALARRAARGRTRSVTFEDAPMRHEYVAAVAAAATRVRNVSRWLNAVSVEATPAQVAAIEALPFVARVDVVRRYRQRREPLGLRVAALAEEPLRKASTLDYGTSFDQVNQIKVAHLHDLRLDGRGVIVAVLDSGFDNLTHQAFATMSILATRDFVNGDTGVEDGDRGEGSHGTATLSVLGGFHPGQLIGPAYAASYLLAKTENTESETPVEEDNWAAAAEWAESLGADVISSSLGYLDYDAPFASYTAADMDGDTAISTRAADLAAERGVVVVTSAGNAGFSASANTLGAPADGHLVLAVGAVSASGARVSFSSVGPTADGRIKPDVAARGASVKVAQPDRGAGYTAANGTSFSCPLAAGVAALLVQANPQASVDQILGALRLTASQAARPDNLLGYGVVDALAAVRAVAPGRLPD
jgi:subtilisin family serine protease